MRQKQKEKKKKKKKETINQEQTLKAQQSKSTET